MKDFISFFAKVIAAFCFGIVSASFAENVSRYHYAEVVLFFFGAVIAFYFIEGLTKKIFKL